MKILTQSIAVSALFLSIASTASAATSNDVLEGINFSASPESSWRVTADPDALAFSSSSVDSLGTQNTFGDLSFSRTLGEKIENQSSSTLPENPWKIVGDNFVWKFNGYSN